MSVVTISCTAFMLRERCFNKTDPATATLGSHLSEPRLCFWFLTGMAAVTITEYSNGERAFNSMQTFWRDRSCISEAEFFLSSDGLFVEIISQHSFEISFKKSLSISVLKSLILKAALAMSIQVPCNRHLPRGSSSFFNLRCFVCDGQVTTTF